MGSIQTSIGLITGIEIGETVDSLIKIAGARRDLLIERTDALGSEQVALSELSALLLSVKLYTDNLGKDNLYDQRQATSSDPSTLSATVTGSPPQGTYQFTPLQTVQSQQMLSSGFASQSEPLGGGTMTFRFGSGVEPSTSLELFNAGQGAVRGEIRITDRSGISATIDLSTARTVDDVLEAINDNHAINVTAVASGDGLRLLDNTGKVVSNLKVEEVGSGTTAASLGWGNIDVAADIADGEDMIRLYDDIDLDMLNDGAGVLVSSVLPDIEYELRDGTTGVIDLSPIISGSSQVARETTLGDILDVINAAEPDKLKVEISQDGDRLVMTDTTEGFGTLRLSGLYESEILADLGLDGEAVDGVVVGSRVLAGTNTVLLSSLNGGSGLGQLGSLELTDRSGASDIVDLSGTETLKEVIDAINNASVGITARVNKAGNGIELVDTTAATAGNLIVANGDATATAEKLGIAVDDDVLSVESGDMHLQIIAHNTKLSELNGGAGVAKGTLTIVDTDGQQATLDVGQNGIETVGDVIQQINRLNLNVLAELNNTGDGILIRDTGYGTGTLQIKEGSTSTAADLHLLGSVAEVEIDGISTQVIDGTTTHTIELDEDDTLEDLRQIINDLDAGVTALMLLDGSYKPYRLTLSSDRPGKAGELVFDTSGINLSLDEMVRAQDALLIYGEASSVTSSVLISSPSNTFKNVISGATLKIEKASTNPVTVTVGITESKLVSTLRTMVDNYNEFRDKLEELTEYDMATGKSSILTGDYVAIQLDTQLSFMLSGWFTGVGSINNLAEVGVTLRDDGKLEFNPSKLAEMYAANQEAVRQFFTDDQYGVSAKLAYLIEQISGGESSLLSGRLDAISSNIEENQERVEFMNDRLDAQRKRLLAQFYAMESAISTMQSNLSVLENFKPLDPLMINKK